MATTPPLVECSRCGAGFDVSSMKPDTRFRCENCGAFLRVPRGRRTGLWIGVAAGAAIVVAVVVVTVLLGRNGPSPGEKGSAPSGTASTSEASAATGNGPASSPPAGKTDLAALTFENLSRNAETGEVDALLKLARFCRENQRYGKHAEDAYRRVLVQDVEHEEALENLDLACCEGLHVPRSWHKALVESAWYANAQKLLEQEVKNKQAFCDLKLSYAYAPPFVLVRERKLNEKEDRIDRRKASAILGGMAGAFNRLVGNDLNVDATTVTTVIPLFWHRTDRAEPAFEEAMQIDMLEKDKGITERNPHWCLCGEEDITRLTLSPLAAMAACELVEVALTSGAAKNEKTAKNGEGGKNGESGKREKDDPKAASGPGAPPVWIIQGLANHLGRVKVQTRKFQDPVVLHDAPDAPTLRSLARDPEHIHLKDVVAVPPRKLPKELLELLKERGLDARFVDVRILGPDVPPRDAWGLVHFFLKDDPDRRNRFLDYLKRVRRNEPDDKAFLAAFGYENKQKDLEKLDQVWEEWLKTQAK